MSTLWTCDMVHHVTNFPYFSSVFYRSIACIENGTQTNLIADFVQLMTTDVVCSCLDVRARHNLKHEAYYS